MSDGLISVTERAENDLVILEMAVIEVAGIDGEKWESVVVKRSDRVSLQFQQDIRMDSMVVERD